jgi:hydroxymethylglutaryl-CoA reductase
VREFVRPVAAILSAACLKGNIDLVAKYCEELVAVMGDDSDRN